MTGYNIDYRDIKYPRLEFRTGSLLLVLPHNYSDVKNLVEKHKNWISKKEAFIKKALKDSKKIKFVEKRTDEQFKQYVKRLAKWNAKKLSVSVNKLSFKKMKSKWGSLSSTKCLTINTLMKYLPQSLIKYVVFHEMAHLIERKHNENFWRIIRKRYKNCEKYENLLFQYWFSISRKTAGNVVVCEKKVPDRLWKKRSNRYRILAFGSFENSQMDNGPLIRGIYEAEKW